MREGLKQARAELRHGRTDAALVLLWNELEPARLDGDRRSLRAIGAMASAIAQGGEEGQQAEARRLLEVLQAAAQEGDATAALEGEVRAAGYEPVAGPGGDDFDVEEGEEAQRTGFRLGSLVWVLILVAIIVINILGGRE